MKILHTTMHSLLGLALILSATASFAQAKIGDNPTTINAGSVLEIESTNKGLLMPRISLTNTTVWGVLGTPAAGMHVYNTNASIVSTNISYPTLKAKIGEYYWDGTGWVALAPVAKSTVINSFQQTTGVTVDLPTGSGVCPNIGCAYDLNLAGSFTIDNAANDVVIDLSGSYSASYGTTTAQFNILLAVDKTTPGTFELVSLFPQTISAGCLGYSFNLKSVLQNLPPRTYQVKVVAAPWTNGGNLTRIGIGKLSDPAGCGNNNPQNQKIIVSVSQ